MPKSYYEFICPVKILSGRKALANLPYELQQHGASRPLLVTDAGVVQAGLQQPVEQALSDAGMSLAAVFDKTPPDSSNKVVNEVAALYRDKNCDSLIALGGGSAIDTTKGVNIVVSEGSEDLMAFQGVDRVTKPMQPFIVIPTTSGTGSEVTNVAVISNPDANVKMAFMSNKLYPHAAILDPTMTLTMPPRITAATGMDALTHAVEAYICLQKNPVSDSFALSAIRLIRTHLETAVRDGRNEDARLGMANAALLAGIAFSNSMVGVVHAMAHACGGVAHVPHGVANAVLLPFGMEYNLEKSEAELAQLGEWMTGPMPGLTPRQQALRAIDAVRQLASSLKDACGLPTTLKEAGVKKEQLQSIARTALDDGSITYNPEETTYEELLETLTKAFE